MNKTQYYQIFLRALEFFFLSVICWCFLHHARAAILVPGLVPFWDEAGHGMDVISFAESLKHFSLPEFLNQLWLSDYWPPAFPLFGSIVALFTGYHWSSLRLIIATLSCGCLVLAYLCLRPPSRNPGFVLGALGAFVAIVSITLSPLYQVYSSLVMLEIPGIFVTLAALYCLRQYLTSGRNYWLKRTSILSGVLFFTKFNYFLMWFIPLFIFVTWENRADFLKFLFYFKRVLANTRKRSVFNYFVLAYVGLLFFIHFSGGYSGRVGGVPIELKEIWGNPIYILVLVIVLKVVLSDRKKSRQVIRNIWHTAYPWQPFIRYTLFPIALWLANPRFFGNFLNSVINSSKRQSWREMLTYYPKALIFEISPNAWFGVLLLVCLVFNVAVSVRMFFRFNNQSSQNPSQKFFVFCVFLTSLNFLMVIVHPNYISRYLLTVYPLLCLQVGLTLHFLTSKVRTAWLKIPLGLVVVCMIVFLGKIFISQQEIFTWSENLSKEAGSYRVQSLGEVLCNLGLGKKTTLIGYNNSLSPDTLAWICKNRHPNTLLSAMPKTLTRFRLDPDRTDTSEIFSSTNLDRVIWLTYHNHLEFSDKFVLYFRRYVEFRKSLLKSAYRLTKSVNFDEYTIEIFEK